MLTFQVVANAGLASAWMLWWSLAAAIPVLLHYLYRRRQTSIPWAAMQLLLQVVEREAKRVRLEQLLLLILRTLILVVLAVALARPFWQSAEDAVGAAGSLPATNWIIAVDVSYSMGYRVDNETRLQAAQRRVAEIVETAKEGDAFALVALGRPPRGAIASPSFDRQAVLTELGRLTINDAGCDVSGGLQLVADIARRAQQDPSLPKQVRVSILSDLGSDHWQTAVEGADAKRFKQLAQQFQVDVESLADKSVANLAVTSLQPHLLRAIAGQAMEIEAVVKNFGDSAIEQLPIELIVDGNTLASQRVDLGPLVEQAIRFNYVPASIGQSIVEVAIPIDRLTADNVRRQVIDVRQDYQELLVEQQAGDARVLGLSLHPNLPGTGQQSAAKVSVFELSTIELQKWPVIVLCDLASLGSDHHGRLEQYVRNGGALVSLLGARTQAALWNERESQTPLLGFKLLEPSVERDWNIDPLEYKSPIVAPFAGFPDAGLLTTPIFRYWKIEPTKSQSVALSVELATEEGAPLIVRQRLGSGVVISLLSAPESGKADRDNWNAMATWPSFVPLMQRLVQSALDGAATNNTVLAGEPLAGKISDMATINATRFQPQLTITKPDGSEGQIDFDEIQTDGARRWTFAQTQQSGVYFVRQPDNGSQLPFAVNVDISESSLRSIELTQLPLASRPLPLPIEMPDSNSQVAESSPWLARGWLIALGLLLVAESWLAWALGRRVG